MNSVTQQMKLKKDPNRKSTDSDKLRDPAEENMGVEEAKTGKEKVRESLKELHQIMSDKEKPERFTSATRTALKEQGKKLDTRGIENMSGVSPTAKEKLAQTQNTLAPVLRDVGRYAPLGAAGGAALGAMSAGEGENKGQKALQFGAMGALGAGALGGLTGEGIKPLLQKGKDVVEAPAARAQAQQAQEKAVGQVAKKKDFSRVKPKTVPGKPLTQKGVQSAQTLKKKQKTQSALNARRRVKGLPVKAAEKLADAMQAIRSAMRNPAAAGAAGGLAGAGIGAGVGALTAGKDEEGKKRRGRGALRGALAGAGLGTAAGAGGGLLARRMGKSRLGRENLRAVARGADTGKAKATETAGKAKTKLKEQKEKIQQAIKRRQAEGQVKSTQHDYARRKQDPVTGSGPSIDKARAEAARKGEAEKITESVTGQKSKPEPKPKKKKRWGKRRPKLKLRGERKGR